MTRLVVALLGLCVVPAAAAQISPGPLARPHRTLQGARNCVACHGTRRGAMNGACLACHGEIGDLRSRGRGLHGQARTSRCASCHPDHGGTDFALVPWTRDSIDRFDHRRAGWALEGVHRDTPCRDCHAPGYQSAELLRHRPAGGLAVWVGLDSTCTSCHDDVHRGSLDGACGSCHAAAAWTPAGRFDHDRTDYPLSGMHREAPCAGCHAARAPPGRSALNPVFQALDARECSSCHRDPHVGRLGATCSRCHETTGFAEVPAGAFNHTRTRYPLNGRHRAVACASCHGERGDRRAPEFSTCASCHADPHQGQALLAGQAHDCAACHTESGFTPAHLDRDEHARTRYPLEGRHVEVPCLGCHPGGPGGRGVRFRPAFAACADCHASAHADLSPARAGAGCAACHAVTGWAPSTWAVEAHGETGLALEGRHREASCASCHARAQGTVFRLGGTACATCHVDPHPRPLAGRCDACHTSDGFRPSRVDSASHATLGFALAGAHLAAPCVACHDALTRPASGAALREGGPTPSALPLAAPTACADCHADPHAGQFDQDPVRRCPACHDTHVFAPASLLDHDRDTAFPLEGGHRVVSCARCHPSTPPATGGPPARRYRPVPVRCESCHASAGGAS